MWETLTLKRLVGNAFSTFFQIMEEAFVLMLQDILEGSCSEQIIKAWRELFGFMAKTMLTGQEQASNNLLS